MPENHENIYTVTAVTRLIKYTLEESFPSIWVEGEISNYLLHSSGHHYLTLKDDNAAIKLTIWRSAGQYLKFKPENGMKVRAFGDISVYEKGGNYQLNVKKLIPVGVGELEIAFRQLYEKLAAEGLFDASREKALPAYPMTIGIVTSPTGAAVRDIIRISRRRNDSVRLILYPAKVQGEGAAESIVAGIEYFNTRADIDVIIAGRGGGSLEDLWAFNEEITVRAIANSAKPVISGIGHEIDHTLSDLAADLRASTPSAAAELAVWSKREFQENIGAFSIALDRGMAGIINDRRQKLRDIMAKPVYRRPEVVVAERIQRLDANLRLLESIGKNVLELAQNRLSLVLSRLETLSPRAVLKRGFAFVRRLPEGSAVTSITALNIEDRVEIILNDGAAAASITDIRKTKTNGR